MEIPHDTISRKTNDNTTERNVSTFLQVLQNAHTPRVREWTAEMFTRATKWARYCSDQCKKIVSAEDQCRQFELWLRKKCLPTPCLRDLTHEKLLNSHVLLLQTLLANPFTPMHILNKVILDKQDIIQHDLVYNQNALSCLLDFDEDLDALGVEKDQDDQFSFGLIVIARLVRREMLFLTQKVLQKSCELSQGEADSALEQFIERILASISPKNDNLAIVCLALIPLPFSLQENEDVTFTFCANEFLVDRILLHPKNQDLLWHLPPALLLACSEYNKKFKDAYKAVVEHRS